MNGKQNTSVLFILIDFSAYWFFVQCLSSLVPFSFESPRLRSELGNQRIFPWLAKQWKCIRCENILEGNVLFASKKKKWKWINWISFQNESQYFALENRTLFVIIIIIDFENSFRCFWSMVWINKWKMNEISLSDYMESNEVMWSGVACVYESHEVGG